MVWIPATHPALHSSPTLGLQGNQNSTNSSFTTHTHVHTQPQDDGSSSSATDGEADQPTSPDRQQDPELENSVQDLVQQAFSCTTLSTQQGIGNISMSPQTTFTLWGG